MENKNFEKELLDNIKLNIAISKFQEEQKVEKKKTDLKKVAIILLAIGGITLGGVKAKDLVQSFSDRKATYITQSISEAIEDGYIENLDMKYSYSDGIGLKINSFLMSNNDINFVLDFKLNDKVNLENKNIKYSYIIYNEENEVYHIESGTNRNILKEFMKKNNLKDDNNIENHLLEGQQTYITKKEDNIVISELMSAKDYFPKAKKLYIQVVGVGYNKENGRYKALSNSEWNIELNIPEKFYNEDVVEYKIKENSYVDIEKMMVTSTSTTFVANIKEDNKLRLEISIIDNNGKEYKTKIMNFDAKNKEKVICKFPLKSDMITEKMYLKINAEEKEEQYELIKK